MNAEVHSLLGPYLLDALDPGERAEFEDHLAACATCRTELEALRPAVASLADSTAAEPPAGLRERVLDLVRRTPQLPPRTAPTDERRPSRRAAAWLAAAAAVVIVGAGAATVAWWPEEEPTTAEQVLAADDVRLHDMSTSMGPVRLGMSHEMHMVAVDGSRLTDPGTGMTYQIWWVTDDGMESAGMLEQRERLAVPMERGELEITMEPEGGSPEPTSEPLLSMPASDL